MSKLIVIDLPQPILGLLSSAFSEKPFIKDMDVEDDISFIEEFISEFNQENYKLVINAINLEESTLSVQKSNVDQVLSAFTNMRFKLLDSHLMDLPSSILEGNDSIDPSKHNVDTIQSYHLYCLLGYLSSVLISADSSI